MNIIKESERWHNDATDLLELTRLVELLKEFGNVEFTGSYDYNLMLYSDIDIFLINDNPTQKLADQIARKLIDSGFWTSFMYCNWSTNEPPGPYFCLKRDFRNHRWKIDILTMTKQVHEKLVQPRKIYYQINDKQKYTILNLKIAKSKGLLPDNIPTVVIYDAVIKGNVKDVDEFKSYLSKQN